MKKHWLGKSWLGERSMSYDEWAWTSCIAHKLAELYKQGLANTYCCWSSNRRSVKQASPNRVVSSIGQESCRIPLQGEVWEDIAEDRRRSPITADQYRKGHESFMSGLSLWNMPWWYKYSLLTPSSEQYSGCVYKIVKGPKFMFKIPFKLKS